VPRHYRNADEWDLAEFHPVLDRGRLWWAREEEEHYSIGRWPYQLGQRSPYSSVPDDDESEWLAVPLSADRKVLGSFAEADRIAEMLLEYEFKATLGAPPAPPISKNDWEQDHQLAAIVAAYRGGMRLADALRKYAVPRDHDERRYDRSIEIKVLRILKANGWWRGRGK
jgi:hypothetical protein